MHLYMNSNRSPKFNLHLLVVEDQHHSLPTLSPVTITYEAFATPYSHFPSPDSLVRGAGDSPACIVEDDRQIP